MTAGSGIRIDEVEENEGPRRHCFPPTSELSTNTNQFIRGKTTKIFCQIYTYVVYALIASGILR